MRHSYLLLVKAIIASSFFVALIIWVQVQLGWSTVFDSWSGISSASVLWISVCVLSSHMLRVLRVFIAYRKKFAVTFSRVSGVSLVHNTVSFLLPMRLGEAALPLLSKQQLAIDLKYSTSTLVLLRIFDAHVLLALLLVFTSSALLNRQASFIIAGLILTTPVLLVILILWIRKLPKFIAIQPLVSSFRTLIMLYAMTATIWVIKLAALAALAQQLGGLEFDHAWIGTIIADASALSPVTGFANAGTFEAAFAFPLLTLGYESDLLLNIALNLHILILVTNLIAGAVGASLLTLKKVNRQV